jgi:hypothetical protein
MDRVFPAGIAFSPAGIADPGYSRGIFSATRKKVRTAAKPGCQNRQVKAIRAAARFSYLLFLLRALPESFFYGQISPLPPLMARVVA